MFVQSAGGAAEVVTRWIAIGSRGDAKIVSPDDGRIVIECIIA